MTGRALVAGILLVVAAACGDSPAPTSPTRPTPEAPAPDPTARYRVTFDATWSAATHPNMFPPDPHFSGLIGTTHEAGFRLWQEGTVASNGIEAMAERGSKTPLDREIEQAIMNGRAEHLLSGGGIAVSPGAVELDFDITVEKPVVSLVSMIAPSPDWFVGVDHLNLLEGGDWIAELVVELHPYDAGTDSGASYASRDRDTMPREPISRIDGPPLATNGEVAPLGTFTFRRQ